jgi:hypothetical protein
MHVSIRRAAATLTLPLLGGTLWAGSAALPASAQTWRDSAVQAFNVTATPTATGAVVNGTASGSGSGSTLSFTAPSGEAFASASFTQGSTPTDATLTTDTAQSLVLTSGGTDIGSGTLMFTIQSTNTAVTCTATETVTVSESSGTLSESAAPTSVPGETVTVSASNNSSTGAVDFTGTETVQSCSLSITESNLPAGLVPGNPLVPGNAVPGTYDGAVYTVTDPLGSTFTGTFDLYVLAYGGTAPPPPSSSGYGDEVNPFGNGFDAFRQHQYPGAVIAGWTATQADPATHFIRHTGSYADAYQFEYAPNGTGVGLCVSDPGGGWSSDPLPDGLILTPCNTGPWQEFVPQSNGTLRDVATGLYVNPDGTGAQLRGGSAPVSWGGSYYTWQGYYNLPG